MFIRWLLANNLWDASLLNLTEFCASPRVRDMSQEKSIRERRKTRFADKTLGTESLKIPILKESEGL